MPGKAGTRRRLVARTARAGDGSGFVVLTRGSATRRFPYWFRVSVPRLGSEGRTLLRRPGVYRGDTRGRPARVSSYRYPSAPGPLGVAPAARRARAGLPLHCPRPGRERGRRRRLGGAGLARLAAPGSSRQRGPPRRVHRAAAAAEPVPAGLLRADPGRRRLPPRARCVRPRVRHHQPPRRRPLRLPLLDQRHEPTVGAAADAVGRARQAAAAPRERPRLGRRPLHPARASSTAATAGSSGTRRTASSGSASRALAPGSHKLVFTVSDYQEAKNNENASATLPNTRTLTTSFVVR